MTAQGFALFDTAIGRCGIAWGERGVAGTQLPEARDSETRARMRRERIVRGEFFYGIGTRLPRRSGG